MKTAVWLYLFMFVAIFDLHAQYPVLSPFALSIGATPSFIGLIMGLYSATHIPGNLLAGIGVDRYGSKWFISISLIGAGVLLLLQARVTDPWQLLAIRSVSGFVLAFLSPACMAMLAKLARDHIQQGHLMSGNGLVHTLASVVSPAAGAYLVARLGFHLMFTVLGVVLIGVGLLCIAFLKERAPRADAPSTSRESMDALHALPAPAHVRQPLQAGQREKAPGIPWLFFALPLGISCTQGILYFELPLSGDGSRSIITSGILFSVISLGALLTLSMLFLNRFSPLARTALGSLTLALSFFLMSVDQPLPVMAILFLIGMAKGIVYPAIATFLATLTHHETYGRVFALLSISYSLGSFIGPLLAGNLRDELSPYFLAFLVLSAALTLLTFVPRDGAGDHGGAMSIRHFPGNHYNKN